MTFRATPTGDAQLFDDMLDGVRIGSITVGQNGSGSKALRAFGATDQWFARGEVASLAEWLNSTPTGTNSRSFGCITSAGGTRTFTINARIDF